MDRQNFHSTVCIAQYSKKLINVICSYICPTLSSPVLLTTFDNITICLNINDDDKIIMNIDLFK